MFKSLLLESSGMIPAPDYHNYFDSRYNHALDMTVLILTCVIGLTAIAYSIFLVKISKRMKPSLRSGLLAFGMIAVTISLLGVLIATFVQVTPYGRELSLIQNRGEEEQRSYSEKYAQTIEDHYPVKVDRGFEGFKRDTKNYYSFAEYKTGDKVRLYYDNQPHLCKMVFVTKNKQRYMKLDCADGTPPLKN